MSVNNSIKARVLAHLHQELGLLSAEIAAKTEMLCQAKEKGNQR